jgi:hypothetical protein
VVKSSCGLEACNLVMTTTDSFSTSFQIYQEMRVTIIMLFNFYFIRGLFNDAVSCSDHFASNDRTINE